jgi:hypothetical protein
MDSKTITKSIKKKVIKKKINKLAQVLEKHNVELKTRELILHEYRLELQQTISTSITIANE